MARFILIDRYSGYIFADKIADTATDAAIALDRDIGNDPFTYDTTNRRDDRATYDAWEAPATFPEVTDGQDANLIDRVEAECRYHSTLIRQDAE